MNIKLTKVWLFLSLLVTHNLHAEGQDLSWEKIAPALAVAGVVAGVGYGFYSLMAKYLGKYIANYGPKVGGFVSSVACMGLVVTAITGKNVFDYSQRASAPATIPLSRRFGSGIGGLALLFLSWRYWQSCRPGIEFCLTGLMLPVVSLVSMAFTAVKASKPWYGKPEEKSEYTKYISIAVAFAVGAAAAGIVSWKYYWRPTIYGT